MHVTDLAGRPVVEEVLPRGLQAFQHRSVDPRRVGGEPALRAGHADLPADQERPVITGDAVDRVALGHGVRPYDDPAMDVTPGYGPLADRLDAVVEEIDEIAFDRLREAVADGEVDRPRADRRLVQARRAVEKAAGILRALDEHDGTAQDAP